MTIAYTIGSKSAYDAALTNVTQRPVKVGRCEGYDGGWVWRDAGAARAFIGSPRFVAAFGKVPPECAVYELGVPGAWDDCVSQTPHPDDGVHRLLVDSPIIKKVTDFTDAE